MEKKTGTLMILYTSIFKHMVDSGMTTMRIVRKKLHTSLYGLQLKTSYTPSRSFNYSLISEH